MFQLLLAVETATKTEGYLTTVVAVVIAILVGIGAGIKTYRTIKNKKFNITTLDDLANFVYQQEDIMTILKLIFTKSIFVESKDFDEFLSHLQTKANEVVYSYITSIVKLPESLEHLLTPDSVEEVTRLLLAYLGYNNVRLEEMYKEYGKKGFISTDIHIQHELKFKED